MLKSREIARRFHTLCGEVFPEPEALVSDVPALVGTDGHVCARILLGPSRAIPCSPIMRSSTATGRVGDVEVKTRLAVALNRYLAPIRERLAINEARPGLVETILGDGTQRMRAIAAETMP
jgi:tryptophanyl-tRNA synthetase